MIEDTHNLENTGMTQPQAEAVVKMIRNSLKEATRHLATRSEMAALGTELKTRMTECKGEHKTELKSETAELRRKIAELKSDNEARHLETRKEMAALRTEFRTALRHEMAALRTEFRTELRSEMAALRTELKGGTAELKGEFAKEMGKLLIYIAVSFGSSTIIIVAAALAVALRFAGG